MENKERVNQRKRIGLFVDSILKNIKIKNEISVELEKIIKRSKDRFVEYKIFHGMTKIERTEILKLKELKKEKKSLVKVLEKSKGKLYWSNVHISINYFNHCMEEFMKIPISGTLTERLWETPYEYPPYFYIIVDLPAKTARLFKEKGKCIEKVQSLNTSLFKKLPRLEGLFHFVIDENMQFIFAKTQYVHKNRLLKHPDLMNSGIGRGKARFGGLFYVLKNENKEMMLMINNNSSYCFNRIDELKIHSRSYNWMDHLFCFFSKIFPGCDCLFHDYLLGCIGKYFF